MRPYLQLFSLSTIRFLKPRAVMTFLPLLLLIGWQIGSAKGWIHPYLFPAPGEVWIAAIDLWRKGLLQTHLLVSFLRVLFGFAVSAITAFLLAVVHFRFSFIRTIMHLPLEAIRVIPPLSLVPVLILWFGIGESSKIAVIILASFFPVYLSALTALISVDCSLLEMGKSLNLNRFQITRFILLPGAQAGMITGLRLGFGYAWRALVGAELIAASAGLGYLILDSEELARTDRIFVGIITIALTGMILDTIFKCLLSVNQNKKEQNYVLNGVR